jgi:hypothetical protein
MPGSIRTAPEFDEVHESVMDCPRSIVVGSAPSFTAGAGGGGGGCTGGGGGGGAAATFFLQEKPNRQIKKRRLNIPRRRFLLSKLI